MVQPTLSLHEHDADQHARGYGHRSCCPEPVFRCSLEPIDNQQNAGERERRTEKIDWPCVGIAVLRQQPRSDRKERHHHWHPQKKHRAPPEILQKHPAKQRTHCATNRVAGYPNANREGALVRIVEHVPDQ